MEDLYKAITEYPVIVQGALGSALFALLFYLSQQLFIISNNFLDNFFKSNKKTSLLRLHLKYTGLKAYKANNLLKSNTIQTGLIYNSLRKVISGIIWILFGLIISPFELIGYIGGLYFTFSALYTVQSIDTKVDVNQKLEEIEKELKEIEKELEEERV